MGKLTEPGVKKRATSGNTVAFCATVDQDVKRKAQAIASREKKSFSLFVEEQLRRKIREYEASVAYV
jgi:predicted HicB family RNase H-like nuclease